MLCSVCSLLRYTRFVVSHIYIMYNINASFISYLNTKLDVYIGNFATFFLWWFWQQFIPHIAFILLSAIFFFAGFISITFCFFKPAIYCQIAVTYNTKQTASGSSKVIRCARVSRSFAIIFLLYLLPLLLLLLLPLLSLQITNDLYKTRTEKKNAIRTCSIALSKRKTLINMTRIGETRC